MAKLSVPMQDALIAVATLLNTREAVAMLPASIKSNTAGALEDRKLIELRLIGNEPKWTLTTEGRTEAERIMAKRSEAFNASPEGQRVANQVAETRRVLAEITDAQRQTELDFASLPVIDGYRWQWFNPQGGEPTSRIVIQLMYADDRTLSPAAMLKRNNDGTWRAERGHAWGVSGFIFGTYQQSFPMLVCAGAIAAEADERGTLAAWAQMQDEAKAAADADAEKLRNYAAGQRAHRVAAQAAIASDPLPATVGKL